MPAIIQPHNSFAFWSKVFSINGNRSSILRAFLACSCIGTFSAYLMKIEDEVQFTDIPKVSVQNFHEMMNDFQGDQLIVRLIDAHDKIQAGIPLVNHLQGVGVERRKSPPVFQG